MDSHLDTPYTDLHPAEEDAIGAIDNLLAEIRSYAHDISIGEEPCDVEKRRVELVDLVSKLGPAISDWMAQNEPQEDDE